MPPRPARGAALQSDYFQVISRPSPYDETQLFQKYKDIEDLGLHMASETLLGDAEGDDGLILEDTHGTGLASSAGQLQEQLDATDLLNSADNKDKE